MAVRRTDQHVQIADRFWFRALILAVSCLVLAVNSPLRADDAADRYNLAAGLYRQGRWQLAADSFREFLTNHPQHARAETAQFYLGLALINVENFDAARTALRDYLKKYQQGEHRSDAMYRVAECSYLLNDLNAARGELRSFIERNPKHTLLEWALPYYGDALFRLGEFKAAAAEFEKALQEFPKGNLAEDAKFSLARAHEELKQDDQAIALYREIAANRQGARAAQAQLNLAARFFDAGKFQESLDMYAVFETDFATSNLRPLAQLNSGYCYYQLGQMQKAIEQFDKAAEHKSQATTARYWKALCLKQTADMNGAAKLLQSAYENDRDGPLAADALFQWAEIELRQKRFAEAGTRFLEFVERWPQDESAADSLHFAGEAALQAGRLDDAQKLIDRFDREYPKSDLKPNQDLLRGRLLEARGGQANLLASIAQFEKVTENKDQPRAQSLSRFYLARTHQKLEQHEQVLSVLKPLIAELDKLEPQAAGSSEFVDAYVLAGTSALHRDDAAAAVAATTRYLAVRPDGEFAMQALATRAKAEGKLDKKTEANTDLDAMKAKDANNPLYASTVHGMAESAFDGGDFAWSEQCFARLSDLGASSPQRVVGLSGRAWSLFKQEKFGDAAAAFARVSEEFPDHPELAPEADYQRAQALQLEGKWDEAAAAYGTVLTKYAPKTPSNEPNQVGAARFAYLSGLQQARALRRLKKIDEADAAYKSVLDHFPNPAQLPKLLDEWALLHYEAEKYDRADEIFRRLIAVAPDSDLADSARLSLVESDLFAGKLDEANTAITALLSSNRASPNVREVALHHAAGIALRQHRWKDARDQAEKLIAEYPKSKYRARAELEIAEAELRLDDGAGPQRRLLDLQASLKDASNIADDLPQRTDILLAETYFRQKDYKQVIKLAEEFRARFPESKLSYQMDEVLGRSYKSQAKFEEARAAFGRVVQSPDGKSSETAAKAQFMIADTHLSQNDYSNALKEYLKVYHLHAIPEWQAPALYQAGQCDEQLQDWKGALTSYETLLKEFSESKYANMARARLPAVKQRAGG